MTDSDGSVSTENSESIPAPAFAHLHVHSEYSLMDGMMRINDIVKKAKKLGHTHVAVTDHGAMYGAVDFYFTAKKHGVTPIVGCEIYHHAAAETKALSEHPEFADRNLVFPKTPFHLVLLAKNTPGYKKLVKIVSSGFIGQTTDTPIATEAALQENLSGDPDLVCLSACGRGEFAYLVRLLRQTHPDASAKDLPFGQQGDNLVGTIANAMDAFVKKAKRRHPEDFYVELIDNNLPGQRQANDDLIAAARFYDLPVVATADAHYLEKGQGDTHALLTAIKNSLTKTDIRGQIKSARYHLTSNEEMQELFGHIPEALNNSLVIAAKCSHLEIETGKFFLPKFDDGTGASATDMLYRFSREGLTKRLEELEKCTGSPVTATSRKEYEERLEYELKVIDDMGFPGYFLIVQDFINWAKEHDIPVGPGRGSGAGSLVAYVLRITDLDPIPYNLIFERFLNPDRVSMPDFDVDFCQSRRDEVIQYVIDKYGSAQVAQIATFGKLMAKGAIKSVGRALNISYSRIDRFTKLFPDVLNITLKEALEQEPKLGQEIDGDDGLREVMDYAFEIEGLTSHTSVHAAGVIISDGPVTNYVPIFTTDGTSLITQYEMKKAETVGLVKFDFLGLKTLTVIHTAVGLIHKSGTAEFDVSQIPLDDKAVFDHISKGSTCGIFQLESSGMTELVKKLTPSCFEDVIALMALFRPGPLGSGMVDDFVERKHGRQDISYPHPDLEPILAETYGMILYQEQVQKIAAVLANYTLGEADLLRRAMGKKIAEEMEKQKNRFLEGAQKNEIEEGLAGKIFDLMAEFAKYGFNKSHSAAYGLISYQTAYLKTYFPAEYMAAIMTCDLDNTSKIIRYVEDCRRLGIEILPPEINRSHLEFDVPRKNVIGFGLAAIKGVGEGALKPILTERDARGPFASLTDLATRVDLTGPGKKTIELLIQVGAFDCFGLPRTRLLSLVKAAVEFSAGLFHAKKQGQRSLFDLSDESETPAESNSAGAPWEDRPDCQPDFDQPRFDLEDLYRERKLLGVFLSGHPMDFYRSDLKLIRSAAISDFGKIADRSGSPETHGRSKREARAQIAIVALLSNVFERRTKKGSLMASFKLEQPKDAIEGVMFEKALTQATLPPLDTPVVAVGSVERGYDNGTIRYTLSRIIPLEEVRQERVGEAVIQIDCHHPKGICNGGSAFSGGSDDGDNREDLQKTFKDLKEVLSASPGPTPFKVRLAYGDTEVTIAPEANCGVELSNEFLTSMRNLPFRGLETHFTPKSDLGASGQR